MTDHRLSIQDVNRLLADPSEDMRAETAEKLARQIDDRSLTDAERRMAEDILRLMARDAAVRVRQALALNLKDNPLVPHDVATALARDVDNVALPILEFSEVLTSADLIEIVRGKSTSKQVAIARRSVVDSDVAEVLAQEGTAPAVEVLAGNQGADLSEESMLAIVDRFGDSEHMQGVLIKREVLPITIAEKLVNQVSESLRQQLLERHPLSAEAAAELVLHSRERATIGLSTGSSELSVQRLVRQLRQHKRLTPSILVRAACMGDIVFLECAMADLADVTLHNARILVHDSGDLGLRGIFDKTGLPETIYPALRAAVDTFRQTDYDGLENDRERFSRRMIERILTQYGDLGVDFESDDLEYLLGRMSQLPAVL
ncbi:DUF2336 domain-containing protein [Roseospira marina]|uniref:DUF2336 domain-containing protein n=1 Tax=Roseospira marina TaxID=140057 RepID=A0A5M6ID74_9PROT|nr:DUF2336 domain-containing protein [Roseospira marina]KAA5606231.1 DUF2336 domain-containing protein [Roseospira marina]MBB4314383.1 uncharacterized protein (DUF2336 family) [Roseospira marina]MBB5087543.1 uncharacterized protein (DUF2336 family) [Roseospira marina]